MGALEGIVSLGLSVAPVMTRRGLGDAVGLVDFVLPGMICQGRSKAVAYAILYRVGCLSSLG